MPSQGFFACNKCGHRGFIARTIHGNLPSMTYLRCSVCLHLQYRVYALTPFDDGVKLQDDLRCTCKHCVVQELCYGDKDVDA